MSRATSIGLFVSVCAFLSRGAVVYADPPLNMTVEVKSVAPHDPGAFTQGLILNDGVLLESTGLYGESSLREVAVKTGKVVRRVNLENSYFGEGLALVGEKLVQLTWREGTAFVYYLSSFEKSGSFSYKGEGWGLCFDGNRLVMSDGSSTIVFRDPETFERIDSVDVALNGTSVRNLNELECVKGRIYANVLNSDNILVIDPSNGEVTTVIDASGLLDPSEYGDAGPLNGIAYNSVDDTFFVTGKLWPKMFEVKFVESTTDTGTETDTFSNRDAGSDSDSETESDSVAVASDVSAAGGSGCSCSELSGFSKGGLLVETLSREVASFIARRLRVTFFR